MTVQNGLERRSLSECHSCYDIQGTMENVGGVNVSYGAWLYCHAIDSALAKSPWISVLVSAND